MLQFMGCLSTDFSLQMATGRELNSYQGPFSSAVLLLVLDINIGTGPMSHVWNENSVSLVLCPLEIECDMSSDVCHVSLSLDFKSHIFPRTSEN